MDKELFRKEHEIELAECKRLYKLFIMSEYDELAIQLWNQSGCEDRFFENLLYGYKPATNNEAKAEELLKKWTYVLKRLERLKNKSR